MFYQPPAPGAIFIHRTHPSVACLADYLLERALNTEARPESDETDWIARAGAIFTEAVSSRTTVLLLRLRHQLTVMRASGSRLLLCEETVALALSGGENSTRLTDEQARTLLDAQPARNMPTALRDRHIQQSIGAMPGWAPMLEEIAEARAASDARGNYHVTPSLPVDVMGIFVLIPA